MSNAFQGVPITVIIPCYNASLCLERAVNSVLLQSLRPSELMLVDDASPDDGETRNLIAHLVEKIALENCDMSVIPIYLKNNGGPGGARNAGWSKATQPWVAFLDADDAWDPKKIEAQYQFLKDHPNIDLLAHRSACLAFGGEASKFQDGCLIPNLEKITLRKMLYSNLIPTRSVMLRREIPLRFPENTLSEDYSLWLKILAAGYEVRLMNEVLAYTFRPEYSEGGSSGQLWKQEQGELSALASLYHAGGIQFFAYLIASGWSLLKFVRRFIMRTLHL